MDGLASLLAAGSFLTTLLRLGALGSLLALFLLLLRPLLRRRVSFALTYYLWVLVLLRLCLPVGVTLPLPGARAEFQTVIAVTGTAPANPAAVPPADGGGPSPAAPEPKDSPSPALLEAIDSPLFWAGVWGVGAALSLGWYAGGYLRFSRRARRGLRKPPAAALAILREMDPAGRVELGESSLAGGPVVIGPLRPLILLPPGLEEDRLRDILAHEMVHVRRRDLLYKWFAAAVTSLHWFNPLMPFIRREIGRLCELSCDEAATRELDAAGRRRYGETLLAMAAAPFSGPLAATLCEEKQRLRERLECLARPRKRSGAALALSWALAAAVCGCALITGAERPVAEGPRADLSAPAIRAALLGEREIHFSRIPGTDLHNLDLPIQEIPERYNPDSEYTMLWRFTLVDLDHDGETEAVVQIIDAAGDMGGYLMLHALHQRDVVEGYFFDYRWFESLKEDGTFYYSDSAGTGWGVMDAFEFDESPTGSGYRGHHTLWQAPRDEPEHWYIGQLEVNQSVHGEGIARQNEKPEAVWYDFTPENIHLALDGIAIAPPPGEPVPEDLAAALAEDFSEYWKEDAQRMALLRVNLLQTGSVPGMDRLVLLVHPEYRTSHALAYALTGNTVRRLGDFPSGLEFSFSGSDPGMLRTGWTLEGSGGSERFDSYYRAGPDGVLQTLAVSAFSGPDGEPVSFTLYQDGEGREITREEYNEQKAAADAAFDGAEVASFPTVSDLADSGLDLSALAHGEEPDLRAWVRALS